MLLPSIDYSQPQSFETWKRVQGEPKVKKEKDTTATFYLHQTGIHFLHVERPKHEYFLIVVNVPILETLPINLPKGFSFSLDMGRQKDCCAIIVRKSKDKLEEVFDFLWEYKSKLEPYK